MHYSIVTGRAGWSAWRDRCANGEDSLRAHEWDKPELAEALDFQDQRERESGVADHDRKLSIEREIAQTGTYHHTEAELALGASLAWRNSLDCIGKPNWRQLRVRDARSASSADDVFEACLEHLRAADNGGRIQAVITVLPQQEPGLRPLRLLNSQLIRYAGYRRENGEVVGDPQTVAITELAMELGWRGSGGRFDVLPLVIELPNGGRRWFEIPADAVRRVRLRHPDLPWFADLGLEWYSHPSICNQVLRIGGLVYPIAPFSGWYTSAEISARNLGSAARYDVLPAIAERLGLSTGSSRTLWRDRALVELTTAVIRSFDLNGVTIVDQHFAAAAFLRYQAREERDGRTVQARWRSLVSATGGSATELLDRDYPETLQLPNFFPHPAVSATSPPTALTACPISTSCAN